LIAAWLIVMINVGIALATGRGSLPTASPNQPSRIADLSLPPGARLDTDYQPPNSELWHVPGSYDIVKDQVQKQLPMFKPLGGLPWCSAHGNTWSWGIADDLVTVTVMNEPSKHDVAVLISRGQEILAGC
jgi:hypothetical protein